MSYNLIRVRRWCRLLPLLAGLCSALTWASAAQLRWDEFDGVVLQQDKTVVQLGGNALTNSLRLRFPANGVTLILKNRTPSNPNPKEIVLTYEASSPSRVPLKIERRIKQVGDPDGTALLETFTLITTQPLTNDLEVEVPFQVHFSPPAAPAPVKMPPARRNPGSAPPGKLPPGKLLPGKPAPAKAKPKTEPDPEVTCSSPLQNGWMSSFPFTGACTNQVEYRLGNPLTASFAAVLGGAAAATTTTTNSGLGAKIRNRPTGPDEANTPQLALPLIQLDSGGNAAALFTDPGFSSLFVVRSSLKDKVLRGVIRYRYAAGKIPLRSAETRQFAVWIPARKQVASDPSPVLDAWYRLMLPDVPPGPAWLRDIAMVDYDFLSDDGQGWERDIHALASWLKPAERRRVALCLHGWYDALGSYCYDAQNRRMKDSWIAFDRTRKVKFTQAELKRRLNLARDQGFRVLLYFGDGLAADSGVPGFHDDWAYRDIAGRKTPGWQGPDTFGPTYLLNPAHPEVVSWFTNYMGALLSTYGQDTDGFVWDETFHARIAQRAEAPQPAYCDLAMFQLVKTLRQQVHRLDPRKVFLTSDCIGLPGMDNVPGYAMVADGTYQDSHCDPAAWAYAIFPNWRNGFWSCNWDSLRGFHFTRWGVERFGAPVAISNGWGEDRGPSEWTNLQRDRILGLFRDRLKAKPPARPLLSDPASLLAHAPDRPVPGDLIPEPAPGEINWALSVNGSHATASSSEQLDAAAWPASGAIDGIRDDTGWGGGHGWTSKAGAPSPHWLEVDFGQERSVHRCVVITYQKEKSAETAGKWGIQDYQIEAWDARKQKWLPLCAVAGISPAKVRVHSLPNPVRMRKCRLLITEVAPLDGQARVLQFEAWGR